MKKIWKYLLTGCLLFSFTAIMTGCPNSKKMDDSMSGSTEMMEQGKMKSSMPDSMENMKTDKMDKGTMQGTMN